MESPFEISENEVKELDIMVKKVLLLDPTKQSKSNLKIEFLLE